MNNIEFPTSKKPPITENRCSECGGRKFSGDYWGSYSEDDYFVVVGAGPLLIHEFDEGKGFIEALYYACQIAIDKAGDVLEGDDLVSGDSLWCDNEMRAEVELKCSACLAPFIMDSALIEKYVSRRLDAGEGRVQRSLPKPYLEISLEDEACDPASITPIRLGWRCQICQGDIYVQVSEVVRVTEGGKEGGSVLLEFDDNGNPSVETEFSGTSSSWSDSNIHDHDYSRSLLEIGCLGKECWKAGNLDPNSEFMIPTEGQDMRDLGIFYDEQN
jgi:hypothetical protein